MSADGEDAESGEIQTKTVEELIRSFHAADDGTFTFLIGAGASRPEPAEIPTAGELIDTFQEELYEFEDPNTGDIAGWAEGYEAEHMDGDPNRYGFWFSQSYPTPGLRRDKIQEIVTKENQDERYDPPFNQIVLASMLDDGIISHVFTPNFDDLLFDAIYLFSEHRPLFVDHEEKAKEFHMSGEDPAIVKVHGDFHHYTQNTDEETHELTEKIGDRFEQSVIEYGTIVVGYGGNDRSIMSVLEEASISDDGLWWCYKTDEDSDKTALEEVRQRDENDELERMLRDSDYAYLVEIEGADELLHTLWNEVDRVEPPDPTEIMDRARERRDLIDRSKRRFSDESGNSESGGGDADGSSTSDQIWDARDFVADGEYEVAIEVLDEVIEEEPNNAKAYIVRASAKFELDEYEAAIEDYDRALKLSPETSGVYNNRGIAKADLEEYEAAIRDYDRAIELDPENDMAYYNRGNAKAHLKKYEAAIEDFNRAIELDPKKSGAYNNRGWVKLELEKYTDEEAIEDFNRAIELDPENVEAYKNRGDAKQNLGDYEGAITDYDEAIKLNPEYADAYVNRGNAKTDLEEYEAAIADFDEAIEHDTEPKSAFLNRAEARIIVGEYEAVLEDAQEARSLSSNTNDTATSLLLLLIAETLLENDTGEIESEYESICEEDFETTWSFEELDTWLEDADLEPENEEQIEEYVDMLREHKAD